jgi:nicotinamidase-related amidase
MDPNRTAVLLIGYQNDYFAPHGVLRSAIEDPSLVTGTLRKTVELIERLQATPVLMITTPIMFTADYNELRQAVGILKVIRDKGAFQAGTPGAATIPELTQFGERLIEVPGKRGLNAFSNTRLDELLQAHGVQHVVVCGVVASLCIDSTGRAAQERGYEVTIVSDCISGRTLVEQRFYLSEIYPMYATVLTSQQLLSELGN